MPAVRPRACLAPHWIAFAAALAALSLTGCESNIERSAKLERTRLAHRRALQAGAVSISKPNPQVQVLASAILAGGEGDAVAVTLRNRSTHAIADAPIEIVVKSARGQSLYRNDLPGIASSLARVPLLPPGVPTTWIDDQVSTGGRPAKVSVLVGEGRPAAGRLPQIDVHGARMQGGEEVQGRVSNRSEVAQSELVIDAVARRAGRIVAAGRAVLPEVGAGASSPFQLYLIGDPKGASLQVTAPASSLR
jgi:hypothetical protein